MFVAGDWMGAADGAMFDAESPVTGEVIAEIPKGDRWDAERAISAANDAAETWSRTTPFERAALMHRVADEIERQREGLANTLTLDQGKPLRESRDEVEELITLWRNAAEDGKRLEDRLANSFTPGKRVLLVRRARGVIGVITPWSRPYTMPAELIAPALSSGNTVVWNPATTTSVAALALAECLVEADLPRGVFNLVTGPGSVVGDEIARNPETHGVGFIGSAETGREVARAAAGKAVVLAVGGNGPVVVMDDADLDLAAAACTAGGRLLVQRAVKDEFVEKVARLVAEQIVLGDPFAEETTIGPLNNAAVAQKVDEHVADALERGARLVLGGARAAGYPTDLYWQPTVLDDVDVNSRVANEETLGPVAPVISIDELEDAIRLANSSPYGPRSAIFTRDLASGLRYADEVKTGWVNVNEPANYREVHLPLGSRAPMESFTELRTVVLACPP